MTISTDDIINDVLKKHIEFITALTSFAQELAALFFLEVKLAAASLKYILIYTVFLLFAAFSLWLIILAITVWLSHLWLGGWLLPLLIAGAMNVLLIGLITWRILHYRKNLTLPHTQKYLFANENKGVKHVSKRIRKRNTKIR